MTENDNNTDVQMIRIDDDHVRLLPPDVARAAEVLVAYINGLDQVTRYPDEVDPRDRSGGSGDAPQKAAAAGEADRAALDRLAQERAEQERQAAGTIGGGIDWDQVFKGGTCKPIMKPQDHTPLRSSVPLEIIVVWRARRFPDRRSD